MPRVWGIGAFWSGSKQPDRTEKFRKAHCAEIDWSNDDAPALYEMFSRVEPGDIIYVKSKPPGKRLYIKLIGHVLDKPDGSKVKVEWVSETQIVHDLTAVETRYNVYSLTFYEEMNPTIRWEVKEKLREAEKAIVK